MEKGSFLSEGMASLVEAKPSMRFLKVEIGAKGLFESKEAPITDGIWDGDVDAPKNLASDSLNLSSISATVDEEGGTTPLGVVVSTSSCSSIMSNRSI